MSVLEEQKQFKFKPYMLVFPLYGVLVLWLIYWFEVKFGHNFTKFGLYPRTLKGLRGILFSPFIHADVKHLFNNSVPLFVLILSLFYFYRNIAFKIFIYGTLLTGLLTWLIAREAYHIGASGIVYLLFSFVFFSGVIRKYNRLIAVSLVVIFLYGSMIWYILPIKEGISWEGHLSGFLVGLIFALIYKKHGPQRKQFTWEENDTEDDIDFYIDKDGNFVYLNQDEEE